MTDTNTAHYPDTPAAVAAAVLDAIQNRPAAFDMTAWFVDPYHGSLLPSETPACGTTLCVAGWAAHLTGWTLAVDGRYAAKDGQERTIEDVAREALGLDHDGLFYTDSDAAISVLRRIAAR